MRQHRIIGVQVPHHVKLRDAGSYIANGCTALTSAIVMSGDPDLQAPHDELAALCHRVGVHSRTSYLRFLGFHSDPDFKRMPRESFPIRTRLWRLLFPAVPVTTGVSFTTTASSVDDRVDESPGLLEPLRHKSAELLGRSEMSGLLLLRDLRNRLAAQAAEIAWIILAQAAQAVRDRELLQEVSLCHEEAEARENGCEQRSRNPHRRYSPPG